MVKVMKLSRINLDEKTQVVLIIDGLVSEGLTSLYTYHSGAKIELFHLKVFGRERGRGGFDLKKLQC